MPERRKVTESVSEIIKNSFVHSLSLEVLIYQMREFRNLSDLERKGRK